MSTATATPEPMRPRRKFVVDGKKIFFTDRALDNYRRRGQIPLDRAVAEAKIEDEAPEWARRKIERELGRKRSALVLTDGTVFLLKRNGSKHFTAQLYRVPTRERGLRRGYR